MTKRLGQSGGRTNEVRSGDAVYAVLVWRDRGDANVVECWGIYAREEFARECAARVQEKALGTWLHTKVVGVFLDAAPTGYPGIAIMREDD